MKNYITINKKCPECKKYILKYDNSHNILFCLNCGLVLNDPNIKYDNIFYFACNLETKIKRLKERKKISKSHNN